MGDENKEIFLKVDKLLDKVEALDGKMNWVIRGQTEKTKPMIIDFFKRNKRVAVTYILIDGQKSTSDIAKELKVSQAAITQHCTKLLMKGLIQPTNKVGVYKKDKIEKILHIQAMVEREVIE